MDMVTQLFQKVDATAASAIEIIYDSLATELLPIFTLALTVYVAYWGYEMIYGRAPLTAGAFVWRIARIGLVYAIGFYWSDFSALVVDVFTKMSDGIASTICTGTGGSNCGTPETAISSQLSLLFANAMNAGKTITAAGGWGAAFTLGILGLIVIVMTIVFVAVAITLVLVGKIALFILLGLAPLFIAMALFEFSSPLFSGWLRSCAQFSIVPAIVYGMLGFLLTLMSNTITNLASVTDVNSGLTVIAPFLILCVVGTAMLPQALGISAAIAGGHSLHNPFPSPGSAVRSYMWWRYLRNNQRGAGGGGTRDERPALPPPGATVSPGGASISRGYDNREFSDPGAEQVMGALIDTRTAQYRAINRQDDHKDEG